MSITLSTKTSPFPYASIAIATFTQKVDLNYDESVDGITLEFEGSQISAEDEIVAVLANAGGLAGDSSKTAAYFDLAKTVPTLTAIPDILAALDSLDNHLAYRTFLVGHDITAADFIIWGAIKVAPKLIGLLKNGQQYVHLLRWMSHIESLESTQAALASLATAKSNKARSNKTAAGFALGLQNAKEGQVVTRFPPEPSGYLHIGHAKAAMLNQYFAKMYNGKMIIRFDDTNPTKERSEFEETILQDLELLNIRGDKTTHTSDYFDQIYELAIQIIKSGKAYTDDTEQLQMREERGKGVASAHRDDSIEDNLRHFEEMKSGSPEGLRWCLRAKISVDSQNKALRDPVIYRCNLIPHHRTGDMWKIYPTYDFACPIVDSLEGVTHALRTNEYRERNAQYQWMIKALGIRGVDIWDFSRLNFIYTLLSKRKLHWFVDSGIVKGWDDPRFPTIRGIRRRGLTVDALSQFMLAQGPSQAIVSLEWDSIWAINKKVIDPVAPRFWGIVKDKSVSVTINGGPPAPEVKTLPLHKKNPDIGEKKTVFTSTILVEQEDAASFEDQEEITLMDWGNAIVRSKTTGPSGDVTSLTMDLHLEGDFRKTKKKITWLAQPSQDYPLVDVTLLDYDYLITKKKLEETDDVKDFVTPVSEFREEAFADANVSTLTKGDIIQFERKGYFIFDGTAEDGKLEFIRIPDGRAANLASKAGKPSVVAVDAPVLASGTTTDVSPVPSSTMYKMEKIYGEEPVKPVSTTKMYTLSNVYE
ncbi:tRNA synthetases class I, catalytic domain-containing protein [Suillus clintonianus]|uniref:tRNA synthetases class I, catalytic domain-containing protein n=1 Tax=Suillus clintonianus TaxID=1904413 RepID=UPI001B85BEF3|nr:tRNA synthetases class I, catalytic domain-containing protein [Suillus clintonianus]KAG2157498.1 tRNA synthetases class I, catalytic domain-containing protein [Suillus clintonianus]